MEQQQQCKRQQTDSQLPAGCPQISIALATDTLEMWARCMCPYLTALTGRWYSHRPTGQSPPHFYPLQEVEQACNCGERGNATFTLCSTHLMDDFCHLSHTPSLVVSPLIFIWAFNTLSTPGGHMATFSKKTGDIVFERKTPRSHFATCKYQHTTKPVVVALWFRLPQHFSCFRCKRKDLVNQRGLWKSFILQSG